MPDPTRTLHPAISSRPRRSSERLAHEKPLGCLPLALLALLAAGLCLILRAVNNDPAALSLQPRLAVRQ